MRGGGGGGGGRIWTVPTYGHIPNRRPVHVSPFVNRDILVLTFFDLALI